MANYFGKKALVAAFERIGRAATDHGTMLFFLKHIWPDEGAEDGAPEYPR